MQKCYYIDKHCCPEEVKEWFRGLYKLGFPEFLAHDTLETYSYKMESNIPINLDIKLVDYFPLEIEEATLINGVVNKIHKIEKIKFVSHKYVKPVEVEEEEEELIPVKHTESVEEPKNTKLSEILFHINNNLTYNSEPAKFSQDYLEVYESDPDDDEDTRLDYEELSDKCETIILAKQELLEERSKKIIEEIKQTKLEVLRDIRIAEKTGKLVREFMTLNPEGVQKENKTEVVLEFLPSESSNLIEARLNRSQNKGPWLNGTFLQVGLNNELTTENLESKYSQPLLIIDTTMLDIYFYYNFIVKLLFLNMDTMHFYICKALLLVNAYGVAFNDLESLLFNSKASFLQKSIKIYKKTKKIKNKKEKNKIKIRINKMKNNISQKIIKALICIGYVKINKIKIILEKIEKIKNLHFFENKILNKEFIYNYLFLAHLITI